VLQRLAGQNSCCKGIPLMNRSGHARHKLAEGQE